MLSRAHRFMTRMPRALILQLLLVVLASCHQAAKKNANANSDTSWLACGPFPLSLREVSQDFGAAFRSQVDAAVAELLAAAGSAPSARFRDACTKADKRADLRGQDVGPSSGRIRLDQVFPGVTDSVFLFERLVTCRGQETLYLSLGSDDGFAFFLNGKLAASRIVDEEEGAKNFGGSIGDNKDLVEVVLKEGVNSLLIAVPQRNGAWGITYRLGGKEEAVRVLSEIPVRPSTDVVTNPFPAEHHLVITDLIHRMFRPFASTTSVILSDLQGRILVDVPLQMHDPNINLPSPLQGPFVVEVRSGKASVSQSVFLGRPTTPHDLEHDNAEHDVLRQRLGILEGLESEQTQKGPWHRTHWEKRMVWVLHQLAAEHLSAPSRGVTKIESYPSPVDGSLRHYLVHVPPVPLTQPLDATVVWQWAPTKEVPLPKDHVFANVDQLEDEEEDANRRRRLLIIPFNRNNPPCNETDKRDFEAAIADAKSKFSINGSGVYLTGWSTGGGCALEMVKTSKLFASVSVFAPVSSAIADGLFDTALPTRVFVGEDDEAIRQRLERATAGMHGSKTLRFKVLKDTDHTYSPYNQVVLMNDRF